MASRGGKVTAFAELGATLRNPVWSWSALTKDDNVVLALWHHRFDNPDRPRFYSEFGNRVEDWTDKKGNRDRIQHLKWARDQRQGLFLVVWGNAPDIHAEPKRKASYRPTPMVMRLVNLDEETGEFSAETVSDR